MPAQNLEKCFVDIVDARLAQSEEHETLNLRVVGSSPTLGGGSFSKAFQIPLEDARAPALSEVNGRFSQHMLPSKPLNSGSNGNANYKDKACP